MVSKKFIGVAKVWIYEEPETGQKNEIKETTILTQ